MVPIIQDIISTRGSMYGGQTGHRNKKKKKMLHVSKWMTDKTKLTRRQLQKVKTFRRRLEENLRSVFTNSLPLWSNGLLPTELRLKINLYTRLPRINNRSSPKLIKKSSQMLWGGPRPTCWHVRRRCADSDLAFRLSSFYVSTSPRSDPSASPFSLLLFYWRV